MNYWLKVGMNVGYGVLTLVGVAVLLLIGRDLWKTLRDDQLERPVITDKRRLLKIKLKSLAAESRIIRQEELRLKNTMHWQLREEIYLHRVHDVREETRATLLAYAFVRGKAYRSVESHRLPTPKWEGILQRATSMVVKYGTPEMKKDVTTAVKAWVEDDIVGGLARVDQVAAA